MLGSIVMCSREICLLSRGGIVRAILPFAAFIRDTVEQRLHRPMPDILVFGERQGLKCCRGSGSRDQNAALFLCRPENKIEDGNGKTKPVGPTTARRSVHLFFLHKLWTIMFPGSVAGPYGLANTAARGDAATENQGNMMIHKLVLKNENENGKTSHGPTTVTGSAGP